VFVRVPQVVPEQAEPERFQVTPWFWLSLDTVAVMLSICPPSIEVCEEVESATAIGGLAVLVLGLLLLPPPPQAHNINKPDRAKTKRFIMISSR
jgi:hypothetical protein